MAIPRARDYARRPDMHIEVNGERREAKDAITVRELLVELGLADQLVAVERNEQIVTRAEHVTTRLSDGDRVEIVQFVGGG